MVDQLILNEVVKEKVCKFKDDFLRISKSYLEISDADFLGVIFMTPAVAIAMADNKISFFKMIYLGKKAREYSKCRYFLFRDPVIKGVKILSEHLRSFEQAFIAFLKEIIDLLNGDKEIVAEMEEVAKSAGGLSTAVNVGLLVTNTVIIGSSILHRLDSRAYSCWPDCYFSGGER